MKTKELVNEILDKLEEIDSQNAIDQETLIDAVCIVAKVIMDRYDDLQGVKSWRLILLVWN